MALKSDVIDRITVEVINGQTPTIKDDEAMKEFREEVTRDIVQMKKDGIEIEIQQEVPSI